MVKIPFLFYCCDHYRVRPFHRPTAAVKSETHSMYLSVEPGPLLAHCLPNQLSDIGAFNKTILIHLKKSLYHDKTEELS